MTDVQLSAVKMATRVPLWPVLVAPLVAAFYYLPIKRAFAQSIVSVLGRSDLFDISTPRWGSHWVFRCTAEAIAVGFGTFVAAGLSIGRERLAAIVAGCTISLGFVGKLAFTYLAWRYGDPAMPMPVEPWYQSVIDFALVIAAPLVGSYVSEAAKDTHRESPNGFGGINRIHVTWLWFAVYWYALGLITPIARIYAYGNAGIIAAIVVFVLNGVPALAFAIPGYFGILLLSGAQGNTMHPAGRDFAGISVLVFGFFVASAVQGVWYWIAQKLYDTLAG